MHTMHLQKDGLCPECSFKRKASEQMLQPLNMAAYANNLLGQVASMQTGRVINK
jgi:hypothetical protein